MASFLQKFPLILLFSIFTFLTFILNEKLQFISLTYLLSHGVDEKGQSGLEPADPTATPMFFRATWGRDLSVENCWTITGSIISLSTAVLYGGGNLKVRMF